MHVSIDCNETAAGDADVSIEGLALTNPRFTKYPMLLSLLKFHSPSTDKDDTSSSLAVSPDDVQLFDRAQETDV